MDMGITCLRNHLDVKKNEIYPTAETVLVAGGGIAGLEAAIILKRT